MFNTFPFWSQRVGEGDAIGLPKAGRVACYQTGQEAGSTVGTGKQTYALHSVSSPSTSRGRADDGVPTQLINCIIGRTTTCTLCTGSRPFPTELPGETDASTTDQEFAATNGSGCRCGWFGSVIAYCGFIPKNTPASISKLESRALVYGEIKARNIQATAYTGDNLPMKDKTTYIRRFEELIDDNASILSVAPPLASTVRTT